MGIMSKKDKERLHKNPWHKDTSPPEYLLPWSIRKNGNLMYQRLGLEDARRKWEALDPQGKEYYTLYRADDAEPRAMRSMSQNDPFPVPPQSLSEYLAQFPPFPSQPKRGMRP